MHCRVVDRDHALAPITDTAYAIALPVIWRNCFCSGEFGTCAAVWNDAHQGSNAWRSLASTARTAFEISAAEGFGGNFGRTRARKTSFCAWFGASGAAA